MNIPAYTSYVASDQAIQEESCDSLESSSAEGESKKSTSDMKGHIDWNRKYQNLLDLPEINQEDIFYKFSSISKLSTDFETTAQSYGKIIIKEAFIPLENKSIRPQDTAGGLAGGQKYLIHGIFFKFAIDRHGIYTSDENSKKAASHELRALIHHSRFRNKILRYPMMILMDYLGLRLIASSQLPINSNSLIYGSNDQGTSIKMSNQDVNRSMSWVAKKLNLKEHTIGDYTIAAPCDMEVHAGKDGRFYCLDFHRLFPPEYPVAFKDSPRDSFLVRFLRPEYVAQYSTPLSSDSFSSFSRNSTDNLEAKEAFDHLWNIHLPKFIAELENKTISLKSTEDQSAEFIRLIHKNGINVRYIGHIRSTVKNELWCKFLLLEMCARAITSILFEQFQLKMEELKTLAIDPFLDITVELMNKILGNTPTSASFWKDTIKRRLRRKFVGNYLLDTEKVTTYDLRLSIEEYLVPLFSLVCSKSGILLTEVAKSSLLDHPSSFYLQTTDFKLEMKSKSTNITLDADARWLLIKALQSTDRRTTERLIKLIDLKWEAIFNNIPLFPEGHKTRGSSLFYLSVTRHLPWHIRVDLREQALYHFKLANDLASIEVLSDDPKYLNSCPHWDVSDRILLLQLHACDHLQSTLEDDSKQLKSVYESYTSTYYKLCLLWRIIDPKKSQFYFEQTMKYYTLVRNLHPLSSSQRGYWDLFVSESSIEPWHFHQLIEDHWVKPFLKLYARRGTSIRPGFFNSNFHPNIFSATPFISESFLIPFIESFKNVYHSVDLTQYFKSPDIILQSLIIHAKMVESLELQIFPSESIFNDFLQKFTGLTTLNLTNIRRVPHSCLKQISNLTNLTNLYVSCHLVDTILDSWNQLTALKVLSLENCFGFSSKSLINLIKAIHGQKGLEVLILPVFVANDELLEHLAIYPTLRKLEIKESDSEGISVTDNGLTQLSHLTNLRDLTLHNMDHIQSNSWFFLSHLVSLKRLHLNRCASFSNMQLSLLKQIPGLNQLSIKGKNQITHQSLSQLVVYRNIELDLSYITQLTTYFSIETTHLTLNIPDFNFDTFNPLIKVEDLVYLDITCNYFQDKDLDIILQKNLHLEHLILRRVGIFSPSSVTSKSIHTIDSCPYVHNYGLYKLISKLENLLELQILNCNEITQIDIKIPYLYKLHWSTKFNFSSIKYNNFPYLRELHLSGPDSTGSISILNGYSTQFQTLSLSVPCDKEWIGALPCLSNLINLEMNVEVINYDPKLLSHFTQLYSLSLTESSNENVDTKSLENFLESSKSLKNLYLANQLFKENKEQLEHRFEFSVNKL